MSRHPRRIWKLAGTVCVALVIAAVMHDVYRGLTAESARTPPLPSKPPADIMDPSTAAYRPEGGAWQQYLQRSPLVPGALAPRLAISDHLDRRGNVPTPHKPSVWLVLCGCRDCAAAGQRILELQNGVGRKLEVVIFISSTSNYVWDRMRMSLGGIARMVEDKDGAYYRQLRAPGRQYSQLPMVWGVSNGRVRYFNRPARQKHDEWVEELRKALRVERVEETPSYLAP